MTDEQAEEVANAAAGEAVDRQEPDDVEGLRTRLEEEKQRAGKHYESWQRSAADYQNYKRRMEEERREVARLASVSLIINLLPLMDDIERALKNVDPKLSGLTWIDGIWMIYRKFEAVLQNAGVTEIEADAQQFDPTVHEAISEVDGEEGKVLSVVQKGYKLGDRVIRPAMVVVGKGGGEQKESIDGEENGGDAQNNETEGPADA
ncbi:MAG: nucleotide exchange factor GrpE [Chloroflexi bacterium]|nr:nucleotide exchange factor GrpE [Chloroflexota bacterium]